MKHISNSIHESVIVVNGVYFSPFSGLFLMIGFAVYRSKVFESVKDEYPNVAPHAGFALCVIAWLVTWTATGVTVLMCFVEEFD